MGLDQIDRRTITVRSIPTKQLQVQARGGDVMSASSSFGRTPCR